MARQLSPEARLVLRQLGRTAKSLDELAARTKMSKRRLSRMVWDLRKLGWISASEELRALPVYRRVRLPAPTAPAPRGEGRAPLSHFAALDAWLGIRRPAKPARKRTVRGESE